MAARLTRQINDALVLRGRRSLTLQSSASAKISKPEGHDPMTAPDHHETYPGPMPFASSAKIRKRAYPITIDQALSLAHAAGYMPTPRSRPARAHLQRSWNNAATIEPVPSGVVVKPAWTTAQMLAVAGVLVLFVIGVCLI